MTSPWCHVWHWWQCQELSSPLSLPAKCCDAGGHSAVGWWLQSACWPATHCSWCWSDGQGEGWLFYQIWKWNGCLYLGRKSDTQNILEDFKYLLLPFDWWLQEPLFHILRNHVVKLMNQLISPGEDKYCDCLCFENVSEETHISVQLTRLAHYYLTALDCCTVSVCRAGSESSRLCFTDINFMFVTYVLS